MTHPLFRKDIFVETAFAKRFQKMLQDAWDNRSWHLLVADPGAGKTMSIRDLQKRAGGRSVLAVVAPKNNDDEQALGDQFLAALGLPIRGHWSTRKPKLVNACVILRPNNFDPPVIFFPKLTRSNILTPSFSHTAVRCGSPTLRQVVSTWTRCGGRLAPRRANEGYTAEPAALARLVCQAYHRRPGRTPCRPQCLDSLTPDASRARPLHPRPQQFASSPAAPG